MLGALLKKKNSFFQREKSWSINDNFYLYRVSCFRREYHALSRGFILQEIFRRVEPNRKTVGQYLSEKVFKPLGNNKTGTE